MVVKLIYPQKSGQVSFVLSQSKFLAMPLQRSNNVMPEKVHAYFDMFVVNNVSV